MPVMDGFEFLEANSRAPSPCAAKIALVTTAGNKERLVRAEHLGVDDHLRKPFAPDELRALVTKWFEGRCRSDDECIRHRQFRRHRLTRARTHGLRRRRAQRRVRCGGTA
ncbi:MAG: response regulator, partial [Planctomycetes bacterium]|nr:response regulator [Planctomycetota bacterium]